MHCDFSEQKSTLTVNTNLTEQKREVKMTLLVLNPWFNLLHTTPKSHLSCTAEDFLHTGARVQRRCAFVLNVQGPLTK